MQHGFDSIGLAENVYSPTKSRRRANKMKTAATSAMNAYDYAVGQQPVNPYAQTGADMFFQQPQTYTPLVVSLSSPPATTWFVGNILLTLVISTLKLPYHRYAPLAPFPQKLQPFQKTIHGFFMSDNLREELQRKAEATLQSLPSNPAFSISFCINRDELKLTRIFSLWQRCFFYPPSTSGRVPFAGTLRHLKSKEYAGLRLP